MSTSESIASDPRGIAAPDAGRWKSTNVKSDCIAGGPRVLILDGCGLIKVNVGQSGLTLVDQASGESSFWTCGRLLRGL